MILKQTIRNPGEKMADFSHLNVFRTLEQGKPVRVCAFGASNTQRRLPGMHWFDYVELGFKQKYGGGSGQFLNAGIGGNTTRDLLERFDRDVAPFRPELTLVTIGGNDINPTFSISCEEFKANLADIYDSLSSIGSQVIFQTYYACDLVQLDEERRTKLVKLMQIVRETASELGAELNDNDTRWVPLRENRHDLYSLLMKDAMHVNELGNRVIGMDLMRRFGILAEENAGVFADGLFIQAFLDTLEKK